MITMIKLAFKNIKENWKWAVMTVLGISVSLMLITMVISFAAGTYESLSTELLSRSDTWNEKIVYNPEQMTDVTTLKENLKNRDNVRRFWIQSDFGYVLNKADDSGIPVNLIELQEGYDTSGQKLRSSVPVLVEGRFAEAQNEIALNRNFRKDTKIGSFVTLSTTNGEEISMEIVGFVTQPIGQVASYDHQSDIFVFIEYEDGTKLKDERTINQQYPGYMENEYNSYVNSLRGLSKPTNKLFWAAVYLCTFIVLIIALSSISLIYNAFYLSLEQKVQQIGVLKSVCATNKQIGLMVYIEGILLTLVSITIGIFAGYLIAQQSLLYIGKTFNNISGSLSFFNPKLTVEVIIVIYAVGILTVILPIRKSVKYANLVSPVEIIRNISKNEDTYKYKKTPKFISKLFGTSGSLAFKNYNRDRKKHRSTAISLIIVIVLLVSISSFIETGKELTRTMETGDYDISFSNYRSSPDSDKSYYEIVDRVHELLDGQGLTTYKTANLESINYEEPFPLAEKYKNEGLTIRPNILVYRDKDFIEYFGEENLRKNYFNPKLTGQHYSFKNDQVKEVYINHIVVDVNIGDSYEFKFHHIDSKELIPETLSLTIDELIYDLPSTVSAGTMNSGLKYIMSETQAQESGVDDFMAISLSTNYELTTLVKTPDHEVVEKQIHSILSEEHYPENFKYWMTNKTRDSLFVTSVLGSVDTASLIVTGFIFIICVSNLLNVMASTSRQRLKEYGVYRSVGMELKELRKMLFIESFIISIKPLILGITLGIISSYVMFYIVSDAIMLNNFGIDFKAIIYAILMIAGVQSIQLISSISLLKKSNIVEDLKRMEM